jgi:hypothetical protein
MELRAAGATFRQIADQLGVSVATAWKCVDRGLTATRQEPGEKLHALERERLDRLQAQATAILRTRHVVIQGGKVVVDEHGRPYVDHGPTLNAIRTLLAVAERRAKLLGLDEPIRIDAKVSLRLAWERASEQEKTEILDAEIAELERELANRGPATPPPTEMISPPTGQPTEDALVALVERALAAAGLDPAAERVARDAIAAELTRIADQQDMGGDGRRP